MFQYNIVLKTKVTKSNRHLTLEKILWYKTLGQQIFYKNQVQKVVLQQITEMTVFKIRFSTQMVQNSKLKEKLILKCIINE